MGKKQRRSIAEAIAAVPECELRVILTTGSYIGEGFDDARLDTLFLAMPISWKRTLKQYVGRSTDFMMQSVLFGSTTMLVLMS
jgi:superfamily II DNA or RNA helicase